MFKNWNWKHYFVWGAFFCGFIGAALAFASSVPAGTPPVTIAVMVGSMVMVFVAKFSAFRMNPPSDPSQAFQQGESSLTKAAQAGFARVALLGVLSLIAFVAIVASALGAGTVAVTGCTPWWQKNQQTVVQDLDADAQCVLGAILGGAQSPQAVIGKCVGMTEQQALAMAANLFNYFVLGQADGGAPGVALPPYRGIPASLPPADIAKLRAFAGS